jgi:hypothetical protein
MFALILALVAALPDDPPRLIPTDPSQFVVVPDQEANLSWRIVAGRASGPLSFTIRDHAGQPAGQGEARTDGDRLTATVRLSAGYHELDFESLHQRFGLIAAPALADPPDPFFAIDGALTWLVHDEATRTAQIALARRLGIAQVRERLRTGALQPAPDRWSWDAQSADALREAYRKHTLPVLEMAHDAPDWMGHIGTFPADLAAYARHWEALALRWQAAWGGVELWNEPDISFSGNLPADQYASVAKAMILGLRRGMAWPSPPILGGALAHDDPDYLESLAASNLLEALDVFSFHTYARANEMERIVSHYRTWLRSTSTTTPHGDLPLWITECGRPWPKGTDRPTPHDDLVSAHDIARKAIEARACGIARYFAFVLPFYEENTNNFGLLGRESTPLLGLAAYAQAIQALAHTSYLGDLTLDHAPPDLPPIRVFARESDPFVLAVVCSPKGPEAGPIELEWNLPITRLLGLDGRILPTPFATGPLLVSDGLVYALIPRAAVEPHLDSHTPAMALHPAAKPPAPAEPTGLVLRFDFDPDRLLPASNGYQLRKSSPGSPLPLAVSAWNLTDQPLAVDLHIHLDDSSTPLPSQPLTIQPGQRSVAKWPLPLDGLFNAADERTLTIEARTAARTLDRLALTLRGETDLPTLLARFEETTRLPIHDLNRWTRSASPGTTVDLTASDPAGWKLAVSYPPNVDRWAYPSLQLPDGLDLAHASGLVVRARLQDRGAARVFLWDGPAGYINPASFLPADNDWHAVLIPFSTLTPSQANTPDTNQRLDLDQVRRLSIGLNSEVDCNTLEVSDAYLVGSRH